MKIVIAFIKNWRGNVVLLVLYVFIPLLFVCENTGRTPLPPPPGFPPYLEIVKFREEGNKMI